MQTLRQTPHTSAAVEIQNGISSIDPQLVIRGIVAHAATFLP
jgi:hypothetical protein